MSASEKQHTGAPEKNERKRTEIVMLQQVRQWILITFGTMLIAASVFFFMMPSHLAVGSISGLAIVLSELTGFGVSAITLVLNIALLAVGMVMIGRDFGVKTIYTSLMLPVLLGVLERLFPHFSSIMGDPFLDMVCYLFLAAAGCAMLFNLNASSGGLDILAKILNKYFRMELGVAMSLTGICVALSAALVYDPKTVALSILGTYLFGLVLDHFIFGMNIKKRVCIMSDKREEITGFILNTLHSGASLYQAVGAYTGEVRQEIIVIVTKQEYIKLIGFISQTDPAAFVTVYNVNEVIYRPKNIL